MATSGLGGNTMNNKKNKILSQLDYAHKLHTWLVAVRNLIILGWKATMFCILNKN
jgi:hypothetical protein